MPRCSCRSWAARRNRPRRARGWRVSLTIFAHGSVARCGCVSRPRSSSSRTGALRTRPASRRCWVRSARMGRAIDGVLLVDKPAGMTSHDVVAIVRRAAGESRIGHAGTLDPFATGLLVLLLGRSTRLLPYLNGEPKTYEASIRFGSETDTDDATGTPTMTAPVPALDAIEAALPALTGAIAQVPPAYSAKQIAGRRAYDAARAGAPLSLAPVTVTVHEWKTLGFQRDTLAARI